MSDGFDSDWLALREPADHAARAGAAVEQALPVRQRTQAVDLGGGTGSNLRYLIPRLGGEQHWWLLDHDPALLAAAGPAFARWGAADGWDVTCSDDQVVLRRGDVSALIRLQRFDLALFCRPGDGAARAVAAALAGPRGASRLPTPAGTPGSVAAGSQRIDLVTASALLDLVGRPWIESVLDWCRLLEADWLFALTFDGRIDWQPAVADDDAVQRAFDQDQRRDKGFGAALGPDAVPALRDAALARGYRLTEAHSDWMLTGAASRPMQDRLANDYAAVAASAIEPPRLERWLAGRRAALAEGRSALRVGHQDVCGRLPA